MTSNTMHQKAREAQSEAMLKMGAPAETVERVNAIYDGMDEMNHEQKTLLVTTVVSGLSTLLKQMAGQADNPMIDAFAELGHGLLAMAGYVNESMREEAGYTSTGDSKVDNLLADFQSLIQERSEAGFSPEEKALAEPIKARLEQRLAEGMPVGEAMRRAHEELTEARTHLEAPAAKTSEEASPGYGLYL